MHFVQGRNYHQTVNRHSYSKKLEFATPSDDLGRSKFDLPPSIIIFFTHSFRLIESCKRGRKKRIKGFSCSSGASKRVAALDEKHAIFLYFSVRHPRTLAPSHVPTRNISIWLLLLSPGVKSLISFRRNQEWNLISADAVLIKQIVVSQARVDINEEK